MDVQSTIVFQIQYPSYQGIQKIIREFLQTLMRILSKSIHKLSLTLSGSHKFEGFSILDRYMRSASFPCITIDRDLGLGSCKNFSRNLTGYSIRDYSNNFLAVLPGISPNYSSEKKFFEKYLEKKSWRKP